MIALHMQTALRAVLRIRQVAMIFYVSFLEIAFFLAN